MATDKATWPLFIWSQQKYELVFFYGSTSGQDCNLFPNDRTMIAWKEDTHLNVICELHIHKILTLPETKKGKGKWKYLQ
jgi:hypothetical protein